MARLLIIYDGTATVLPIPEDRIPDDVTVRQATLDIADDIDKVDIYEIARKLAEMLLEQL